MKFRLALLVAPSLVACTEATVSQDCASVRPQEVVGCHLQNVRQQPLDYTLQVRESQPGYVFQRYRMTSQDWAPAPVVAPRQWEHDVELYIPDGALPNNALLVVNNGVRYGTPQSPDYSPEALRAIALQTRTVVAMITDAPNQEITFSDVEKPLREDYAVAHTWATWLRGEEAAPELPLHVPMAAVASRAMDVLQQEMGIERFVISGASKRGWSAWLTAMADDRIIAIVPAVIDVADTSEMLVGLRKRYGGSWPLALVSYQEAGVLQQLGSAGFDRLMAMMDPMQYLDEPGQRLAIPKYLISASGDDFFAPDPVTDYLQRMPGQASVRVLPNSNHGGVRAHVVSTLVPLIARVQNDQPLPTVKISSAGQRGRVEVRLSEMPVAVKLWTAANQDDRDFRYACGIRYEPETLPASQAFALDWTPPQAGWQARFIEAVFADGFTATSPVSVMPETFPAGPPKDKGGACKSFPS
ncbi:MULTISPECIES: PhoPQ-activated pathogenicity-related family protein [Pseudomonas]|uniref:PhoPQ-activated pathogenicity-related protein n=1 Tax=Pseudomonas putida TaxID=303 RepID=A0A1B2FC78_PSEPU|nr:MULTISPECIES: PhoPQ-activated protein PqaA family protein [Pseudomonas]ANY89803.1 PhoPQ-activated pathogenicity-related protein [Pseudomonas putida]MCL8303944.1 PhoPQ-activated pathogenicity-related family protein [Pseudomonas putida]